MADSPKIRHNAPNVFDYGTLIEDATTFYVNNKLYEGFKQTDVTRTLNSIAGNFQITILDRFTEQNRAWELTPGKRAHLHLGKQAVFEGYIDSMGVSYSENSRNMTIEGRDRIADAVDCSAVGECEYSNLTLTQIATKLLEPFGLTPIVLSDVGAAFPLISIKPGEKVSEVLLRLARQRGLLLYSSTHGNLIISKRGEERAPTELVQGVNVKSASVTYDNTERFSEYVIKTQNDGIIGSSAKNSASNEGKATDAGVGRYRPLVVISEASGDASNAKDRAQWEATFRSAKSTTVSVTVKGWRGKQGELWDVNKLVYFRSSKLGLNDQFLINEVKFKESPDNSRTTTLELVRKDAYENKPEVPAEEDPILGLGT